MDARGEGDGEVVEGVVECQAQWPLATWTAAGFPTERLYVRVRADGITEAPGGDPRVEVELGIGGAEWVSAAYNPLCLGCTSEDEYMGTVTPAAAGAFAWGARARLGDGPWTICDGAPALQVAPPGALRAVQLNLRCLVDDWDARRPVMVAALAAANPDFIGMQEVCSGGGRDNLNELLTALEAQTGRAYTAERAVTHLSFGDAYEEGIAIVAAASRREILVEDLPPGAFPRKLLAMRAVTADGPVVFATMHLDHLDADARAAQIADALAALGSFAGAGEPVIAAGDLNEDPSGGVYDAWIAAGYRDVWSAVHPGDPGFTFPTGAPASRIDYVWVRGPFTPSEATLGDYGSDHLGIAATLDHEAGP